MNRLLVLALFPAVLAGPALAQTPDPHAGHSMPAAKPPASPAAAPPAVDPHAGHQMPAAKLPADPHAGHAMPATPPAPATSDPHAGHQMAAPAPTGADLPVGDAAPPPAPAEAAADRVYGAASMDRARTVLRREHGGARASQVMLNLAEFGLGSRAYQWEGEAWFGGDEHRFVLKSEGEGARGHGVEDAEVQALYSRPIGVYTDVQAGLRHDFEPGPSRTYATVGFETLIPYWIEAEGALFLSEKGKVSARLEGSADFRLTQRLVLQPRGELSFAAEDARRGVGSGLSDAELGLRLRYEIRREFAPYVGVVWSRKFGDTADFARAAGEDVEDTRAVVGLRAWF